MDFSKATFYTLKRIGIFLMIQVFVLLVVPLLVGTVVSVFSIFNSTAELQSVLSYQQFMISSLGGSLTGWLVTLFFMGALFWRDGKIQTAYEEFSIANAAITLICLFFVYFVPSAFIEDTTGIAHKVMVFYYYPASWLLNLFEQVENNRYMYAAAASGLLLVLCLLMLYGISHAVYRKKYFEKT